MARNGSGTMSIINSFSASTTIESAKVNQNFTDIASEITASLPRNGEAGMSGQLKIDAGSVAAPGVAFSTDLDTGWYRIGANQAGFACNGAKVLDVSTTGLGVTGALDVTGALTLGTALAVAEGGTGSTSASDARTALGLAIGTNVQAYSTHLDALAGLDKTDGNFAVANGTTYVAESGATARASLGLGTIATQAASGVAITGGEIYGALKAETAVTASGQTELAWTSIPTGVKRITLSLSGLSSSGTSVLLVQLGTGGSYVTTNYSGYADTFNAAPGGGSFTTAAGFRIEHTSAASRVRHGHVTLTLVTGTTWAMSGSNGHSDSAGMSFGYGSKDIGGAVDRIRVIATNGTDTFDAGVVGLIYE